MQDQAGYHKHGRNANWDLGASTNYRSIYTPITMFVLGRIGPLILSLYGLMARVLHYQWSDYINLVCASFGLATRPSMFILM